MTNFMSILLIIIYAHNFKCIIDIATINRTIENKSSNKMNEEKKLSQQIAMLRFSFDAAIYTVWCGFQIVAQWERKKSTKLWKFLVFSLVTREIKCRHKFI